MPPSRRLSGSGRPHWLPWLGPLLLLLLNPLPGHSADPALVQSLRAGGYVIYFRHAATEWSQTDRRREADWDSCDPAQMRQLSDAGRDTARRVGEAMRQDDPLVRHPERHHLGCQHRRHDVIIMRLAGPQDLGIGHGDHLVIGMAGLAGKGGRAQAPDPGNGRA